MCEWLECDAEALNGQSISTVKMATSEPVRETRDSKKFRPVCLEIIATSTLYIAPLLYNFASLKRHHILEELLCLA